MAATFLGLDKTEILHGFNKLFAKDGVVEEDTIKTVYPQRYVHSGKSDRIGLLITSINLLPAGQLDGGHIFRAFLGEKQKYAGWIAVIIMIFTGWTFFAIIIVLLMGTMHPPPLNDNTKLDIKRKILFFVALGILILCFIPFPFRDI